MATKAKKAAPKKTAAKPAKKTAAPKAEKAAPAKLDLQGLDRRGLASKARSLKQELLAIRFNPQAPSLRDYRTKKKELAAILAKLGSVGR
jgi:hypothetical protein